MKLNYVTREDRKHSIEGFIIKCLNILFNNKFLLQDLLPFLFKHSHTESFKPYYETNWENIY